jgi:hypothetical protein
MPYDSGPYSSKGQTSVLTILASTLSIWCCLRYLYLLTALVACSPTPDSAVTPESTVTLVPIPEKATWESNMTTYGTSTCNSLSTDLDSIYYDGEYVYFRIASYTGNTAYWNACARKAEAIYRDQYAIPNNGKVPSYWLFTKGLRLDFERTADGTSQTTAQLLAQNSAFAADGACCPAPAGYNPAGQESSREVAYAIVSYLDTEALGYPKRKNKDTYISYALGHINQWFVTFANPISGQWGIKPFMVGLTMRALIQAYDETPPAQRTADMLQIPAKIKVALDGLWAGNIPGATPGQGAWLPASEAFFYATLNEADTCGSTPCIRFPAPDLNLLIAPAFAWYYLQSGDPTYRTRGDQVFAGGVKGAVLTEGKEFNQNYLWSFDYVTWREAADVKYGGTVTASPPGSHHANRCWIGGTCGSEFHGRQHSVRKDTVENGIV